MGRSPVSSDSSSQSLRRQWKRLPRPPGFVSDFLNGREQVLENRARPEADLGVDHSA